MTDVSFQIVDKGGALTLSLSGAWLLGRGTPSGSDIIEKLAFEGKPSRVTVAGAAITEWDSGLLVAIRAIQTWCAGQAIPIDIGSLPGGAQELLKLASAVPERQGARRSAAHESWLTRVGKRALSIWEETYFMLGFVGDATLSFARFLVGRARFRPADLWLTIEACGPQALGIVTTISVLVGAILAFVGAIQLKMFGAEVYVANLVGLGMVIEMGALMTGIILAGRTGAAFAAQLGTMQVNEEIDALKTLGIPPMDYLVLPRMVALAVMTPLLVIYADVVGILGGAVVGIFLLDIPPVLFFNQTTQMMNLFFVSQGIIKGSTFGVLVALAGCMRGIQCGRSASAVGEAATSAVVTSIVMIVLADAVWTFIFMFTG